jgi:protein-S-isoprenylcysteine O-methyltransferase Ste14
MKRLGYAVFTLVIVSIYIGLAVWAEGGLQAFLSHPALIALALVTYAFGFIALFTAGSLSGGVKEDRSNRWVIPAFTIIGLVDGFLPAWTDHRGLWTIDGESIRWAGVVLFAIGCALRIAPVFVLKNRFSGLVAIQPNHELETDGLYKIVRNPSYDGLLLTVLGWALAYRAWVGVILALLLVPVLVSRMNAEERLLSSQFGEAYEAYRSRTWRLIPWVY